MGGVSAKDEIVEVGVWNCFSEWWGVRTGGKGGERRKIKEEEGGGPIYIKR